MAIDATRMRLEPLEPVSSRPSARPADALSGFQKILSDALGQVNELQERADDVALKVALGDDVDLHDAVIAQERAALAFRLTLQVRNKLLEAYQELMRMQA